VFSSSRLRVARKKRRLSRTRLAEFAGVSLRAIVAYETAEWAPTIETTASLARALDFPVDFFFGSDLHEPTPDTASFRSLARMAASTREAALASGALAMLVYDWMEQRFALPTLDLPDLREEEPEMAAIALRHEWGLGERPVRNMIHLVESKGIRVFSMAEDSTDIDAFSIWVEQTPFMFLNTLKSSEHNRFDVAHELGHLVLHRRTGLHGKEAEHEANRFASAFLMPRSGVLSHATRLPTLTLRALIELKKQWIVSVAALAHRLHALNIIKDWHYRHLCIEIAKNGFRKTEPDTAPREMSLVLRKIFQSLRAEGLSKVDVARDLSLNPSDLDQTIFGLVVTVLPGGAPENMHGSPREGEARRAIHRVK
jgi:Zn-dependent peptidase ImmA (M78 family)/DNA-binding XRE family transcriptional regulator